MPNTIPAAGEAMPKAKSVTALFDEWTRLYDFANRTGLSAPEAKVADEAVTQMFVVKKIIMALPSSTIQDLAAKIVVSTGNGDSELDDIVIKEARNILSADAPSETASPSANFEIICAMEEHITVIEDMLNAFGIICQVPDLTDNDSDTAVIQRLSWIAKDHLKVLEKLRGDLWHLNNPSSGRIQNGGQL